MHDYMPHSYVCTAAIHVCVVCITIIIMLLECGRSIALFNDLLIIILTISHSLQQSILTVSESTAYSSRLRSLLYICNTADVRAQFIAISVVITVVHDVQVHGCYIKSIFLARDFLNHIL